MSKTASGNPSRLAQFVKRRIDQLRSLRSQREIASAAGFANPNMLSMVKDGKAKLSMEKVAPLAKALECDPSHLAHLALEQFFTPGVIKVIFAAAPSPLPSPEMKNAQATAVALGVEVRLALREVRLAEQFAKNAVSPAAHAHERLARVKEALDQLVKEMNIAAT